MKYSAGEELDRAMGVKPRKAFLETVMMRSFRNQARDTFMKWKNTFNVIRFSWASRKEGKKND